MIRHFDFSCLSSGCSFTLRLLPPSPPTFLLHGSVLAPPRRLPVIGLPRLQQGALASNGLPVGHLPPPWWEMWVLHPSSARSSSDLGWITAGGIPLSLPHLLLSRFSSNIFVEMLIFASQRGLLEGSPPSSFRVKASSCSSLSLWNLCPDRHEPCPC